MINDLAEKIATRTQFLTYLCCYLVLYGNFSDPILYIISLHELRTLELQRFILTEELLELRSVASLGSALGQNW